MNDISPNEKQPMRVKVLKFLKRNLIFLPTFGIMILILIIWLLNILFYISDPINKFLYSLVLLTLIATDILYIWRKEIPGFIPGSIIRGKSALMVGAIELVIFILVGFYFIIIIHG